jgi:CTP-dependent riboflavin kinase
MPKLSLRARATLYYFVNSSMSISADRLAEEVAEGRRAILAALTELREAGFIITRKERVGNRVVTVSYVTEAGFVECSLWGAKSALQIQHNMQNSIIEVLANSATIINRTTIDERLGEKMGYDFFEGTSSGSDNDQESERLKAVAERQRIYQEQKSKSQSDRLVTRSNRQPQDWNVNQSALEFEQRIADMWNIKPWKLSGSKFYIALASCRKKFDTNGLIELEMMNLFFTQLKLNKQTDGDKLWKLYISRFSELSAQARLRITSPDNMARANATAEEQWKKEFGEDFDV